MLILWGANDLDAQKYFTRNGKVSFHSKAIMENIDAYNSQGTFVIDTESKQVQMAVLIKAFQFEKALMQEHFNENYLESDEFPKSVFKGQVKNPDILDFSKTGEILACTIEGEITIHGISRPLKTTADFKVGPEGIEAQSSFKVKVADFGIKIPSMVKDNIAKEVEVKIDLKLEKM